MLWVCLDWPFDFYLNLAHHTVFSSLSFMCKSMSSWILFSPKSASELKLSHLEPKELFPHFRMQALPQGADETYIWKVRVLAWMRSKKSELLEALETSAIISETLPRYRRKAAWQRASACMSTTWVCDLYGNMGCRVSKGGIQNYLERFFGKKSIFQKESIAFCELKQWWVFKKCINLNF